MAKTARNTIKTWFETGDFPTQAQFWNWLDSFWHKDDAIPTSSVNNLNTLLNGKATTQETQNLQDQINAITDNSVISITASANKQYTIPDGKLLEKIVVIPTADLAGFSVGTSDGGSEISPALPVSAASPEMYSLNLYANGDRDIWFNGITSETVIKIYLR